MRLLLTAFLATALAGCSAVGYPSPSPPPAPSGSAGEADTPRIPLSPGGEADLSALEPEPLSRYGNPESYEVFGVTYETWPEADGYDATGLASWYGDEFAGRPTSSGETFDPDLLTAAHRSLPLPTWVEVTNLDNGRRVVVRVNDRGPFHDTDRRIIDLSEEAARRLGMVEVGVAPVRVRVLVGPRTSSGG